MFKLILYCLFLFVSLEGYTTIPNQEVLTILNQDLPHFGQLKQDEKGFVFVDIDDNYIHNLIDLIQVEGFEKPPYFEEPHLVGAHITVISANEAAKLLGAIEELGIEVPFSIQECKVVKPKNWKNVDFLYLVTVKAPLLEEIRTKYNLPKSLYDFHITIGIHWIDKTD